MLNLGVNFLLFIPNYTYRFGFTYRSLPEEIRIRNYLVWVLLKKKTSLKNNPNRPHSLCFQTTFWELLTGRF